MCAIRPWDFSNPNETILDKRIFGRRLWIRSGGYDVAVLLAAMRLGALISFDNHGSELSALCTFRTAGLGGARSRAFSNISGKSPRVLTVRKGRSTLSEGVK